jgi:hypothetical protein
MRDRLFVLRPSFVDGDQTYFCPYSAQVIGFLAYYPEVARTVELIELDFAKPRRPLSELLGEDHQAAPMLVLGDAVVAVAGVDIAEVNGHVYVEKTLQILRYLAATRNVPLPH